MHAIHVEGLGKVYGRGARSLAALTDLSLAVEPGQIYGLLGPNGAGKTTLVKILLGLRRPTSGRAAILGQPIGDHRVRYQVGYLPEDHKIPLYLTGAQAMTIYGALQGLGRREARARAGELLGMLELADRAEEKVRKYSKGMKQRLGLAQALIHRPKVLFLDEPTDGVDPVGRKVIRDLIEAVAREGTTVFVNSHLLMEVEMICDRVAILSQGVKVREGSVEDLIPQTNDFVFHLSSDAFDLAGALGELAGVHSIQRLETGHLVRLEREEAVDEVIDRVRRAQVGIRGIVRRRQSLEEYFMETIESGRSS